MKPEPPPILRLRPAASRRAVGVGTVAAFGGLVLYLALTAGPMAPLWRGVLLVLGGAALWAAEAMRKATARAVELRPEGLVESGGRMLAPIDQIERVERGTFAFKPSNGFLVRLKTPLPRGWAPGLWWRVGRSLGIGGVTSRAEAKAMAEALAARLIARQSG